MRRAAFLLTAFAASALYASGFQVTAQGARAMGMGLAYTAVADDASAIYYNPAGIAWQQYDLVAGAMYVRNLDADFDGTAPAPVAGKHEKQAVSNNVLPQLYYARPAGPIHVGIGVFTPFGLPMKWESPGTYSGRFISQKALVRTIDVNPTIAWSGGRFAVGVGFDYLFSKIVLERNQPASAALPIDVAHIKLKSEQFDNHGWGWNAGVLFKATSTLTLGASYRSSINVDHEGESTFTSLRTGVTVPPGHPKFAASIEYPSSLNLGAAWKIGSATTIALDADRTSWSSFDVLRIIIDFPGVPATVRTTDWHDSWAYRAGFETKCGPITCRAGYYRDRTPQPTADVGPVLPDANRDGYTVGIGFPIGSHLTVDLGDALVKFKDRTGGDPAIYAGTYHTTGNEFTINFGWH